MVIPMGFVNTGVSIIPMGFVNGFSKTPPVKNPTAGPLKNIMGFGVEEWTRQLNDGFLDVQPLVVEDVQITFGCFQK